MSDAKTPAALRPPAFDLSLSTLLYGNNFLFSQ